MTQQKYLFYKKMKEECLYINTYNKTDVAVI